MRNCRWFLMVGVVCGTLFCALPSTATGPVGFAGIVPGRSKKSDVTKRFGQPAAKGGPVNSIQYQQDIKIGGGIVRATFATRQLVQFDIDPKENVVNAIHVTIMGFNDAEEFFKGFVQQYNGYLLSTATDAYATFCQLGLNLSLLANKKILQFDFQDDDVCWPRISFEKAAK